MGCGVGLEGVALLDLAAAARDMHLGLPDFHHGVKLAAVFQESGCSSVGCVCALAIVDGQRLCGIDYDQPWAIMKPRNKPNRWRGLISI